MLQPPQVGCGCSARCPKSKIIKLDSASQNPENQWANSSNEMLFNFE